MMPTQPETEHQKVTAAHLGRNAYLYVRQSTIRQVFENTESTQRQYALRQRAVALGWPPDRIIVIDDDQGQSGASAAERQGFQRLVAEVGMGHAGIVLGLEVSRLARNCTDWHRLLEICALTGTLILDEDGVYDPAHFNDRLLLGLKGTMSEAELHVLRARLRGGILNKARRGELRGPLPVGFVYDANNRVVLDPDRQIQETIRTFFRTYRQAGSLLGVVKAFRRDGILFPRRVRNGPRRGELVWSELGHGMALVVLHNPRYAGAYFFGRTRQRKRGDGHVISSRLPRGQWQVLLPGTHEGYISWEDYEENQRRLRECAQAHGQDRRKSPPREGPALLQGLAICGVCGNRMTVRYHTRDGHQAPDYVCQRKGIETGVPICQSIPGVSIDEAIGSLLIDTVTPVALEVALSVQEELRSRLEEMDRLRRQHVERARYEADLAQRRYMQVDPGNRLVAASLEAEWNAKLRAMNEAQEEYERRRNEDHQRIDGEQRTRIMALATDFPRLWRDPQTADRERKRMVRLMLEDVTLRKDAEILLHVRFKGGAAKTITLPIPPRSWEAWQTDELVIAEMDRLLDDHTDGQIAAILNEKGFRSGMGSSFHGRLVRRLRKDYHLRSQYERLRAAGMLTRDEIAEILHISGNTVNQWRKSGLLKARAYDDKNTCLYEPPGAETRAKNQGRRLSLERPTHAATAERSEEVQCGE